MHNPDLPNILRLISLLDRNEYVWQEDLEAMSFGSKPQLFGDRQKRLTAADAIRKLAKTNRQILQLF